MRRFGIGLLAAGVLLVAFSGVAAAQGPYGYGWSGYYPDPGYAVGFYTGYGHGYVAGYQNGYVAATWPGAGTWYGGVAYGYPGYSYPPYPGSAYLRFGGGYTQGGDQGPYLRFGGGYIIDRAHSWGMVGW